MPRAEVGTSKYLDNKQKSKGLQRLRWYCQVCSRQMRDENGFKCHTQSESHLRQILIVSENPQKAISDFSEDFKKDFMQLLRSSHGEKPVQANHFYQDYIHNKEHVHMNATRWTTLTEFVKYLGKEGLCRVEENEKGIFISYIDRSPDALARQEAIRRKERQDKGDEEREQRLIREQVERANEAKRRQEELEKIGGEEGAVGKKDLTERDPNEKIKISFGARKKEESPTTTTEDQTTSESPKDTSSPSVAKASSEHTPPTTATPSTAEVSVPSPAPKISMKFAPKKPVNVFAAASKKLSGNSSKPKNESSEQKRPMSEAERIMKAEMERKRGFGGSGSGNAFKKQRVY